MSAHTHSSKAEQLLMREIQTLDEMLEDLLQRTVVVRRDKSRLARALKALTGQPPKDQQGRIAPKLKHVKQAAEIAFRNAAEMPEEKLTDRLIQILKSQKNLSEQGLVLRVRQYVSACPRSESSGLILAPTTPNTAANSEAADAS